MANRAVFTATFTESHELAASFKDTNSFSAGFGEFYGVMPTPYSGRVVVTPSEEVQTLETAGLSMPENVVVNPIPSNYGRIEYNGTTLRVF